MKRAITALTLVCALMLSVVACQVYNPTNNETLYTAMRTEGAISWADYSKKFTEADKDGKYDILKEYEAFRKLYNEKAAWEKLAVAYDAAVKVVEEAEKAVSEAKKAVEDAGDKATDEQKDALDIAMTNLSEAEDEKKEAHKKVVYCTVEDLKALWDKEYDVLWDWNSKL